MNDLASKFTSKRFLNDKDLYRSTALCLRTNIRELISCLSCITVGGGRFLWLLSSPRPQSTKLCSVEEQACGKWEMVDPLDWSKVHSELAEKPFSQVG
jgi:hypothetical protein